MSMVIKDESRQVNIAGLSPYKDTDGKKWFRMKIDMLLRGEDRVSPPLLKLVDVMREDGEVDSVSVGEKREKPSASSSRPLQLHLWER